MLLAEKKKPEDGEVENTVYRGLMEELLEKHREQVPDISYHVRFMQEAYCCVAENLESNSYPGGLLRSSFGLERPSLCLHHPLLCRAAAGYRAASLPGPSMRLLVASEPCV